MLQPESWGQWGGPSHPGVSVVVALAKITSSFGLEMADVVKTKVDPQHAELVISAAFAFALALFILLFMNKNWFNTFRLFAVVTFVLTLTHAILAAIEEEKLRRGLNTDLLKLLDQKSLASTIISFLALAPLAHVLYCAFLRRKKVVPARLPEYDITVVVEGSDSFNNSVAMNGKIDGGEGFTATQMLIQSDLIPGLQRRLGSRATFSFIQYSGIKQLAKHYKAPGSGTADMKSGLKHYQVEIGRTSLAGARRSNYAQGLDGNAQLFLLLQDLNLKATQNGRRQILIVVCDEEWDLDGLLTPSGSPANANAIAKTTSRIFETYPVVVRPNELKNPNEQFFKNELATKSGNYKQVFNRKFDIQLKQAFRDIVADLE